MDIVFNDLEKDTKQSQFITDEVIDLLNFRINQEELSSRIYHGMSLWLNNNAYLSTAKVWQKFADEEMGHAQLAKDYLMSFNIVPKLQSIREVSTEFGGLRDVIQKTFDHEVLVTEQCLALTKKAFELQDFTLFALGQKYNEIQRIEMDESYSLLDLCKLTHDDLILDKYISENF